MPPFVPKDFAVPAGFETADFRVRMLAISDVVSAPLNLQSDGLLPI